MRRKSSSDVGLMEFSSLIRRKVLWIAIAMVFWALVPLSGNSYFVSTTILVMMYIVLSESWNLLSGFTGYWSLGHIAFFGTGAYVFSMLSVISDIPPLFSFFLAGLFTAGLAAAIGYPALRIRGPYFAITTLALNEVLRIVVSNLDITGGSIGLSLHKLLLQEYYGIEVFFYLFYCLMILSIGVVYFLSRSGFGLRLIAIREDEDAAEVLGIDTTRCKIMAFIITAVVASFAGALYAYYFLFIDPGIAFNFEYNLLIIIVTLLGGRGTVIGPIIGAPILYYVSELARTTFFGFHLVIYGIVLVVVTIFAPGGIAGLFKIKR